MMSGQDSSAAVDSLLHDLVAGLTGPGGTAANRSIGLVGHERHAPRPPAHCLRTCLEGDHTQISTRGCAWLAQAARGRLELASVHNGRCPRGFLVSARQCVLDGQPALALAVEGECAGAGDGDAPGGVIEALELTSRLVSRVGELAEENVGLAGEVLRNYEQLNLMFDFTQQIAHVTDVVEIEQVLLGRLGCLLGADSVCLLGAAGNRRSCDVKANTVSQGGLAVELEQRLAAQIERVRQARQVSVTASDGKQVIIGPLVRLDDRVDIVLAVRAAATGDFTSGDMMLVESVLTFGGQIIANSELHEKLRRMSVEVIRALVSAIDQKDHYTSGHSERVGFLACLAGRRLGVSPAQMQVLEWAGLLHDVGKIGVPEDILNKPGRLTAAEFDEIKRHTVMGYEILKPIASMEQVLDGVLYHHEHPDGSGYPEGLAGDEIPLVARIVHAADVLDALSSNRSYRRAYSVDKACEIIRQDAGAKIDTAVAEALLEAIGEFRTGRPDAFAAMFPSVEERPDDQ